MRIRAKTFTNSYHDERQYMYIFEFTDKDEFDLFLDGLTSETFKRLVEYDTELNRIAEKLESRITDKYAKSDYKLSSVLFSDEMEDCLTILSLIALHIKFNELEQEHTRLEQENAKLEDEINRLKEELNEEQGCSLIGAVKNESANEF